MRGEVSQCHCEGMIRRLGEPYRLGFMVGSFAESAELSEAHDETVAVKDGCRSRGSEMCINLVGGHGGKVPNREFDHPLVLAPVIMNHLEKCRCQDPQLQAAKPGGNGQRTPTPDERFVQLAELPVDIGHERTRAAAPVVIVQLFREALGLAHLFQYPAYLANLDQYPP